MNRTYTLLIMLSMMLFGIACAQTNTSTIVPFKDLDAAAFQKNMAQKNAVILDVRTDGEVANGMIEGAVQIDYRSSDFEAQIDALDKNKDYYVYCASGGRSAKTCKIMEKKGFKNVSNLLGGYSAWPYK